MALLLLFVSLPQAAGADLFERLQPVDHGLAPQRLERLSEGMRRYVEEGRISGVVSLVARRDQLAHQQVVGWSDVEAQKPMRRDTIFRIYSMTKPITSVAVLMLMEEGKLRLSDPVDHWLPELANLEVLRDPNGPLDQVDPSPQPITIRDLLTHTSGLAYVFTVQGPLSKALAEKGLYGSNAKLAPDEWIARLGKLPLAYAPGTHWNYSLSTDVLGVLVARVSGVPFGEFLRTRIFEPLRMPDTGFFVPGEKLDRLAVNYALSEETGERVVFDHPTKTSYAESPAFPSGGGGLVSTADDYLRFARMLLGKGELDSVRLLSRKTVELMTQNSLSDEERDVVFTGRRFFGGQGFGLGVSVVTDLGRSASLGSVGKHGWGGAAGTWYWVDPQEELIGVMMIQLMRATQQIPIRADFETLVYQAIDD